MTTVERNTRSQNILSHRCSPPFFPLFIGDPNVQGFKLDLFKHLLIGEEEAAPSGAEVENTEQEEMALKIEREDLRAIMQEAMYAGEQKALASNPLASARGGGDIDEMGEVFAVSVKLCDFWDEDPESWFDRADNQFRIRGIKEDATKFSHVVQALS